MKIEVKIKHPSGEVKCYPVHRLDRQEKNWCARYTTVKGGMHVSRRAMLGENAKLLVDMEEREKPEGMKLPCGEKVADSFYSGQCRERVEAVLKNLCRVSSNDEQAAGEMLFAVRFKKGMSQSDIARLEGVSRQAVSKRIKRDVFLTRLQKTMKRQKKQKREHLEKRIYEQYMAGVKVMEIECGGYWKSVCAIAREYAKRHHLPFEVRERWGHKKNGEKNGR